MKLLEEWKSERYYLKVGEMFVKEVSFDVISLTANQSYADEFDKNRGTFKDVYLHTKLHAEKNNLGKVRLIKIVRTVTEVEMDADKLTVEVLEQYVKEEKEKHNL
ncbi:hypothetical protein Kirov_1 [Bacillus phage Kirov]|uniref:Uncharacterized protein n=1 Tax=Bacillus phage Kirov TaxID=2783539 RepID=A0A7S6RB51_9CAUD|nr:hypothetical protein PQE67_gp001 [Bacillus phage Kirov]QOV08200.1 hypothetical protein Kirov_1 [Bacillus phage Kirov]